MRLAAESIVASKRHDFDGAWWGLEAGCLLGDGPPIKRLGDAGNICRRRQRLFFDIDLNCISSSSSSCGTRGNSSATNYSGMAMTVIRD